MRHRNVNPDDLVEWFSKDIFDLYLQKVDPRHPYYPKNTQLLTPLDDELYAILKKDMIEASGCNLVAIRKEKFFEQKKTLVSKKLFFEFF